MTYPAEVQKEMDASARVLDEIREHDRQYVERMEVIKKSYNVDLAKKTTNSPPTVQLSAEEQEPIFTQQQIEVLKYAFADERSDTLADVQVARDEISALRTKIAELEKELGAQRVSAEAAQEFRRLQWLRGTIKKRDDDADA